MLTALLAESSKNCCAIKNTGSTCHTNIHTRSTFVKITKCLSVLKASVFTLYRSVRWLIYIPVAFMKSGIFFPGNVYIYFFVFYICCAEQILIISIHNITWFVLVMKGFFFVWGWKWVVKECLNTFVHSVGLLYLSLCVLSSLLYV